MCTVNIKLSYDDSKLRSTLKTLQSQQCKSLFPGDSHFLDESGFRVGKDVAFIPAKSTAWTIKVDSQVSVISLHRHTYVLFKEREKS